jgi:Protein of unknown function (DUF2934)
MQSDSEPPEDYVDITHIYRQQWIAEAAYYKAEARGFEPGFEAVDWLAAEQDYIQMLVETFSSVARDEGDMTVTGLQRLATAVGIPEAETVFSETELIRLIQTARNEQPCFRTNIGKFCQTQAGCQWRNECQKLVAEWCR